MGYRFLVVICAIFMIGGCAAFDHDNEPYAGFSPDEIPVIPGGVAGIHTGFYTGTITVDSNECASVVDEVGSALDFSIDAIHLDDYMNITFEDGTVSAGELVGDSAIFVVNDGTAETVYYLTFSDELETVSGSIEVIEPDESGQYADPCASYTVSMEEGDKPEGFGTAAAATGGDDSSGDEGDGEGDGSIEPEFPLHVHVSVVK